VSAPGSSVPIIHMLDKFLYHQTTTYKLLYESSYNRQVVVLVVQLPLKLISNLVCINLVWCADMRRSVMRNAWSRAPAKSSFWRCRLLMDIVKKHPPPIFVFFVYVFTLSNLKIQLGDIVVRNWLCCQCRGTQFLTLNSALFLSPLWLFVRSICGTCSKQAYLIHVRASPAAPPNRAGSSVWGMPQHVAAFGGCCYLAVGSQMHPQIF
jgi:hypothetical protein